MNEKHATGLIIVSHGEMGRELLIAAERIMGKQGQVRVISLKAEDGLETIKENIEDAMKDAGMPAKKVILVDIFGGTPSNASLYFLDKYDLEIVGGINLPMLLTFFSSRNEMPAGELVRKMVDSGRKGVMDIKDFAVERLRAKK